MRTPKELIDNKISYSDMTEEEIEAMIEYKVELKLQSKDYANKLFIEQAYEEERLNHLRSSHKEAMDNMNNLIEMLTGRKIDG